MYFIQVVQLDPNIVVQLFSPLVTSQRIMATQFNNPYTSVSCQDGTTIVFQEASLVPIYTSQYPSNV